MAAGPRFASMPPQGSGVSTKSAWHRTCFVHRMLKQLLLGSATFHALNLAGLIFLARRWRHRYAEEPVIRPRVGQLVADFGVLGSVAIASAAAFGTLGDLGGFGVIHLLSQWGVRGVPHLSRPRRVVAASIGRSAAELSPWRGGRDPHRRFHRRSLHRASRARSQRTSARTSRGTRE